MQGKVVSQKMKKTVVVEVGRLFSHPIYRKRMRKTKNFHAHNELDLNLGDIVEIVETKPLSKTKRFMVKKVLPRTKENKK